MEISEAARACIERSLVTCARSDIQGRTRLAVIRAELLRDGFEHQDTPTVCRDLGFKMAGLTVLTADEEAKR